MNKHNTEHMRELLEKIERLEAENRDLREGLEFYAGKGAYRLDEITFDDNRKPLCYFYTNLSHDHSFETGEFNEEAYGGRRAREVLAKWGKK